MPGVRNVGACLQAILGHRITNIACLQAPASENAIVAVIFHRLVQLQDPAQSPACESIVNRTSPAFSTSLNNSATF